MQDKNYDRKRYHKLDGFRGLILISMIGYHLMWDLVYLYHIDCPWYEGTLGYLWQQSICWSFILLSGFCWGFCKKKWRRGLIVFSSGMVITLVTIVVMPEQRVVFGILTMIGTCMLLMIPLDKILTRVSPVVGLVVSIVFFVVTRNVNERTLGFEGIKLLKLPRELYHNLLTTYLGFPMPSFSSADYFSIIPWIFLFISGYFLKKVLTEKRMECLQRGYCKPLEWMGRQSLIIYILHQPILYAVLLVVSGI